MRTCGHRDNSKHGLQGRVIRAGPLEELISKLSLEK